MKKHIDARIGIIFISLTLILSIFALLLLNGSVAWFAENKDLDVYNMTVSVKSPTQIVESVEYYPISSVSLSGDNNIYTFSSTPIAENENKALGTFSTLIAERQLLVKINLKPEITGARVVADSYADSYMIENEDTVINKDGNSLSSVVEFYSIPDVAKTSEGYVISGESIKDTVTRFSDVSGSYGKITASFSSEIDIYSTPQGQTDNAIFIVIDYYEDSLNYVMDHVSNLMIDGSTDVVSGEKINFICDFEILVVEG